jgi:hypothetical protein
MKAPILLMLFNRPDLTAGLMQAVKDQTGRRVYIAVDGPRVDNSSDTLLCSEVQKMSHDFASSYTGSCQFQLQQNNLGCGPGVKAALDWFFSHEEMGIILEDDCHPVDSFFGFCDSMLMEFKDSKRVWSISGTSLLPQEVFHKHSHFFSKYSGIWGWATWRRSWLTYDYNLKNIARQEWLDILKRNSSHTVEYRYWLHILDLMLAGNINTWDFQVQFISWKENALHLTSSKNLIRNVGFRGDATHTKNDSPLAYRTTEESFPPYDSQPIEQNKSIDQIIFGEKLNASLELANWLFSDSTEKELQRLLNLAESELEAKETALNGLKSEQEILLQKVAATNVEKANLVRELQGYYGVTGAWRCLSKLFRKSYSS